MIPRYDQIYEKSNFRLGYTYFVNRRFFTLNFLALSIRNLATFSSRFVGQYFESFRSNNIFQFSLH